MRIRLYAFAFVVLVAGCTSAPPRPPVLPDVATPSLTTTQVIVTQPCVGKLPDPPAWATDALPADADEFQRARALMVERQQRRQYVPRLEAILRACQ